MKRYLLICFAFIFCGFAHAQNEERYPIECAISIDVESAEVSKLHLVGFLAATYNAIENPAEYFEDKKITLRARFPGVGKCEACETTRLLVVLELTDVPVTEKRWRFVLPGLKKLVRSGFGEAKFPRDTAVGACAGELKDLSSDDFEQLVN